MKGGVGSSMHLEYTPRGDRLPDPHRVRIIMQWWYEWVEDGERLKSPNYSILCRHGAIAAAHGLLMGREKYGIRHGSEVLIHEDGEHSHKKGVRAARLYIDGRLVAGAELKDLFARVEAYQARKVGQTARRLEKLDAALARIR